MVFPPITAEKGEFTFVGEDKEASESNRESAKSHAHATEETPRSRVDDRKRRDGDKDARENAREVHEVHLPTP